MGSNEIGSLIADYHEPYDFTLSVHEDIPQIFFNMHEFGAIHDIDGHKVPCIFTGVKRSTVSADGVMRCDSVLFVLNEDVNKVVIGMKVVLNGRAYIVSNANLIQGELWRIELEVYEG